jgi:hypothetical protein
MIYRRNRVELLKGVEKRMQKLQANFLYSNFDEEIDVVLVGFADDEFDTNEYLLLQKSMKSDEQDKALGLDKVHITYKDDMCSAYGVVEKLILKSSSVEIFLDFDTSKELQIANHLIVEFPINLKDAHGIKQHLEMMFQDEVGVFESNL